MSVQTTADEARDKAVEHMDDAIKELSKIVIERCSGTDEYKMSYRTALMNAMSDLIEIRDNLDPRSS